MTREEYAVLAGQGLTERDEWYLEDEFEAYVWAHQAVSAIVSIASMSASGDMDPGIAVRAMIELSARE